MRRLAWVGAVAIFVALALFQLYPAWWDPAHGVVGDWRHPDMISNHWLYRWIPEQLVAGRGILHNDRYYVPVGDAPWLAGNGSDAVPYTPLATLLPWPASLTLWIGLAMVLNGVSATMLARRFGAGLAGSVAAGAAVCLLPYVDAELAGGRFAQMPVYQVTFFLVAWHALLEGAPVSGRPDRATVRRGVVAGLLFGLAAFSYWYHGLWAALLGATWFAFRPRWRALVPFVPVALAVTVPPLAVFLANWSAIPGADEGTFPHALACQSSLPPWFPFVGRDGFWGPIVLPLVLLVGAPLALLPARLFGATEDATPAWAKRAALLAALLFWALCLGPYPSWAGGATEGVPGPFWLLYGAVGPLQRFWWPYRHVVGLVIALAPLGALGVDRLVALLGRFAEPQVRRWVPAAATLVLAAALPADLRSRGALVAAPASRWEAPAAYADIGALPGDVLLALPLSPDRVTGQQTLSYQWVHGKRLLNGHAQWVDRVRPAAWDERIEANTLLRALQAVEAGQATTVLADEAALADLAALGLDLVVLDATYFPGGLAPLRDTYHPLLVALFGEPLVDRDGVAAFSVDRAVAGTRVDVPATVLPDPPAAGEGRVPEYGEVRPLGWTTLTRDVPPRSLEAIERGR